MKLSGIFWLVVLAVIHIIAYLLGWWWLAGCYVLWTAIGIYIHSQAYYDIMDYDDNVNYREFKELFLESPYLFTLPYLIIFCIGLGILNGVRFIFTRGGDSLSSFNKKLNSIDLKPKPKPKKQSYGEFKDGFKSDTL